MSPRKVYQLLSTVGKRNLLTRASPEVRAIYEKQNCLLIGCDFGAIFWIVRIDKTTAELLLSLHKHEFARFEVKQKRLNEDIVVCTGRVIYIMLCSICFLSRWYMFVNSKEMLR